MKIIPLKTHPQPNAKPMRLLSLSLSQPTPSVYCMIQIGSYIGSKYDSAFSTLFMVTLILSKNIKVVAKAWACNSMIWGYFAKRLFLYNFPAYPDTPAQQSAKLRIPHIAEKINPWLFRELIIETLAKSLIRVNPNLPERILAHSDACLKGCARK